MQLLNIATNSIVLFSFAYFLIALAAHLWHCWQHPPKPSAPTSESPVLLLPPASTGEVHLWQIAAEKQLVTELIAACQSPVTMPEPSADALAVEELLEAIDIEPPSDYALMTIRELKRIASDRQIRGYGKRTKAELIALLTV